MTKPVIECTIAVNGHKNQLAAMYTKRKICFIKTCEKIATKRGYCSGHYMVRLHKGKFNTTREKCSIGKCEKLTFGESKTCWNHYRSQHSEGSRRWKVIKNNPDLYARAKESRKKYRKKVRSIPRKNTELNAKYRTWWLQNREKALESSRKWKKFLTKEQKYKQHQRSNANHFFGGWENRENAIRRDCEKCTQCGITREEHKKRWNQDLHVDHKDNNGRNVQKQFKNNRLDNLLTLCVRCHAQKSAQEQRADEERLRVLQYGLDFTEKLKEEVRKRDHRKCVDCGISERSLRKRLSIHHVDGNKKNNTMDNLISLCLSCHYKRELSLKQKYK